MGAFNAVMDSNESSISISHLYTVEFPLSDYEQIARDVDDISTYYTFLDITQTLERNNELNVEYLHEGDILNLGEYSGLGVRAVRWLGNRLAFI